MMRDLSDQVHQLRLHSRRLLPKIYSLVSGLSPTKHKAAVKFIHAHPELVAKLTRRFPEHPTSITWDKADKFARETLYRCAHSVVESLDSVYYLLEDMVIFQDQALRLFGDVNQRLSQAKARDRSNEILGYWMDLLCDMISLHFLGCRTPQKAALQVYLAAHFILHGADPPHSSQIVNFVVTFSSNPMASLQAEFSQYGPRLRQVVGNVVWPVLSQITSMLEASKLGLFRIGTADACEGLRLDSLMNANHLNLASVPDYKKWVLCACLICPGILMHLDVRTALSNILSSCTKMQIFNDQCVSVHELFDQTVKPALEHIYKSESKGMKDRDKKADIKASIRELVGVSRSIWDKGGWEIKKADRLVLIHECRKIYAWAEENPANMAGSVLRLLGLLSITRDEILWYFNEVGGSTKVPEAPTMSLGVQPMPKLDGKELDPLVVSLIDIHVKLQMLMLRYRTLITTSIVQDIKDQLVAHILPDLEQNLAAIRSHGESFFLVANRLARLVSIMQTLPNKLAKVANGFWKWNTYSEFGEVWRSILFLLIEKQNHPIWAWSAEGGDGYDWMNKVNKVALQCGVIGSYVDTVAHYSSLHVLCFYRSQIQCLLRQCMGTLIPEGVNPMSLLHVFSQFLRNDIDSPDPFQPRSPNQFNQFAEQSCKDLVHMFMEKIKQLIVNCLRTVGQDATSAYNVVSSMDIMSSSESELFQSTAEQGSFDVHWRRLCSLVATFSDVGEVQVTERFKFNPEVYLSDAISSTYRASLTRQVFKGALLQPPSKLEEEHRKFMTLCKILQSYTKFDIVSPLHSVRRSLVGTPVANPSGPLLMPSIADWYTGYFIRDTRNLGILFSPGNRSFVALNINEETASAVSCGRLSELRCLVMVIGTEGVQQLELHWRAEVTSAASLLLEALKAQKSLLEKLSSPDVRHMPQNKALNIAGAVKHLKNILDIVQKLARALALRQLLSEAYDSILDDVPDGSYKEAAGTRQEWRLNNLGLPGPGRGYDASPSSPDPSLVECLAGEESWLNDNFLLLPCLLACALSAFSWSVPLYNANGRFFNNGMHHIGYCAKAIALALEEVVQQGCKLEDDTVTSASLSLECFVAVASSLILSRSEPRVLMNARYIFMDTMCCQHLTQSDLEKLGIPKTRIRTAYESFEVSVQSDG